MLNLSNHSLKWKIVVPMLLVLQTTLASANRPAYAHKHQKLSEVQAKAVTTNATIALLQEGRVDKAVDGEAAVESEIKAPMSRSEIEHMNSNFTSNFGGGI
jgi:hypothetical protein